MYKSAYKVAGVIIPSSIPGKTSASGLNDDPVCLKDSALFNSLDVVFSPNCPTHPTTYPVPGCTTATAVWVVLVFHPH